MELFENCLLSNASFVSATHPSIHLTSKTNAVPCYSVTEEENSIKYIFCSHSLFFMSVLLFTRSVDLHHAALLLSKHLWYTCISDRTRGRTSYLSFLPKCETVCERWASSVNRAKNKDVYPSRYPLHIVNMCIHRRLREDRLS